MKFKAAIVFCLFFFGVAFSQNDTATTAAPDSAANHLPLATSQPDTTITPDSTATQDTTVSDTTVRDTSIRKGLHFFVNIGAQFINFKDRDKFQNALELQFLEYQKEYREDPESRFIPQKQDFQQVNLTFPISAGLLWQFSDLHSLGVGAGFMYSNESVILLDKFGDIHNYKYTLQAVPAFAEYRLQISPNLISLKNGDYFSLFFRYYWMLPGTEIYSSLGKATADFEPSGNGFGVFLGYRFWNWERFSFWGEMGYLSLDVKSSDKDRVLDSWNLGGISILIRVML